MTQSPIWTFFYGSNINLDVLQKVNYEPTKTEVAVLSGFDIQIAPLANLTRTESGCVYGIIANGTHDELERLYGDYVQAELGATYLPEAVLCTTLAGAYVPALCYIAPQMNQTPPTDAYLKRIVDPARDLGFPSWYLDKLLSFGA